MRGKRDIKLFIADLFRHFVRFIFLFSKPNPIILSDWLGLNPNQGRLFNASKLDLRSNYSLKLTKP